MKKINYIFVELILVIAISLAAAYYFFILDKNFNGSQYGTLGSCNPPVRYIFGYAVFLIFVYA
jgi:hypothetical protein